MKGKGLDQSVRLTVPMDEITMGECLHLYAALGWTADIRAGHLLALGREITQEVPQDEKRDINP